MRNFYVGFREALHFFNVSDVPILYFHDSDAVPLIYFPSHISFSLISSFPLTFIENKSIFEEIVIVHLNFGFVDFSDFSHKLCSVLNLRMFYNELILGFS